MIHNIISALIGVFIVLFIVNKDENRDFNHFFVKLSEMFTKQNLVNTINAFKTPRAWFILIVVFLALIIF